MTEWEDILMFKKKECVAMLLAVIVIPIVETVKFIQRKLGR